MKKKLISLFVFLSLLAGQAQDDSFSEKALADTFLTLNGEEVSFNTILKNNEGRTLLLDIWATWCKDCIIGMPDVKKLTKEYPDVSMVYLSLDKTEAKWKKGIKRFEIEGGQHYWAHKGWESDLFTTIDLDWIPRYMIIDKDSKIRLFRAIKANDKKLEEQIITLKNEK